MTQTDTIAAVATSPGRGSVGIVRLSGPLSLKIAEQCLGFIPKPRFAHYCDFKSEDQSILDQGIALYFSSPNSFTGEDIFEFQGHGGPIVLDLIYERLLELGARPARPGEFSERAFMNDKIDLTQAEAIADLIDAGSRQAARQAINSLCGQFAEKINELLAELTDLRIYVESAIDFPEEEIDFLSDGIVAKNLSAVKTLTEAVLQAANQGRVLRDGMKVVLAGKPNAGKSTLLNRLAERDIAIVTEIPGTTRDTLTEFIHMDGLPLHITDTAGIRETDNEVEKIGIARAWQAIEEADQILLLVDAETFNKKSILADWSRLFENSHLSEKITLLINKSDLVPEMSLWDHTICRAIQISAKTGLGFEVLKNHLLDTMGIQNTLESSFSARRRHLEALEQCLGAITAAQNQLENFNAGELVAEELRVAQEHLGSITGKLSSDDLLGKIFSSFCIGK